MAAKQASSWLGVTKLLHPLLVKHFNTEELKTLCFNLYVPYDALDGVGTEGKSRELILYMERQGRIHELEEEVFKLRPNISKPEETQVATLAPVILVKAPPFKVD